GHKSGVQRDDQLYTGLFLLDVDCAVADVLRPHADHIAPTLSGIEQKSKRQSRARSYWVVALELLDLVVCPAVVAFAPDADSPHVAGWIVDTQANFDRVLHHNSQRHSQRVGSGRSVGVGRHQLDDMIAP